VQLYLGSHVGRDDRLGHQGHLVLLQLHRVHAVEVASCLLSHPAEHIEVAFVADQRNDVNCDS